MVSLSNWMMGAVLLHASSKTRVLKNHVDVYASPLGFCWKPYATERDKERWRTRSRKVSSITVVITDLSPPSRRVINIGSFFSSYPYADKLLQSIEQTPVGNLFVYLLINVHLVVLIFGYLFMAASRVSEGTLDEKSVFM
ncbi:hypothetical protein Hanom_Chr08g00682521 [Helianthus anomalus]